MARVELPKGILAIHGRLLRKNNMTITGPSYENSLCEQ